MATLQHPLPDDSTELLSTKLALPRSRPSLMPRNALLSCLDAGLDRKLTLISAPAGFGKTSLASEWAALRSNSGPRSIAITWVSIDPGDNDPVRFWRYVLAACRRFGDSVGVDALQILRQMQAQALSFERPQQFSFEPVLTSLLNGLARLEGRFVLILEDYHAITSTEIHEAMAFFLEHLPDNTHIMMLTRSDPPLPLARLRARNETTELRAADLRFSLQETHLFLKEALPFPVSEGTVDRLQERTEGWAAGLNLMALTLQGRHDPQEREQFLEASTGSFRHIVEYLVGDVLSAQPESMQRFLLETSGLSRLTGSLCDAVTGRDDGEKVLEQLERANLFLLPLDGARQWYRYHALFAEAMLHEARQRLGEDALRLCYSKASAWYEQNGLLTEAIEAAFSAHDPIRAASLMEGLVSGKDFSELEELHTLLRWIMSLPEDVVRVRPDLCFTLAAALLFTQDRSASSTGIVVEKPLAMAEQGFRAQGDNAKLGGLYAFRALVAMWQGEITQTFHYAREAVNTHIGKESVWGGVGVAFLAAEKALAGELNTARQILVEARAQASELNRHGLRALKLMQAALCIDQGELYQSEKLFKEGLSEANNDDDPSDAAPALLGLAQISYERNLLNDADELAQNALVISKELGDESVHVGAMLLQVLIMHARGERVAAQQLQHTLPSRLAPERSLLLHSQALALGARLALANGDVSAAQRWATSRQQYSQSFAGAEEEEERIVEARLVLAQGEIETALGMLQVALTSAQEMGHFRNALQIQTLIAIAYWTMGEKTRAKQLLEKALMLGQPEEYMRTFMDEGETIAVILRSMLRDEHEEALNVYIQKLLSGIVHTERDTSAKIYPARTQTATSPELVEPLSKQEQRVLRLFAAGLSREEIAGELVVSVNTVKTHLQRVYRKLNVTSRAEARETARHLRLL